MSTLARTFASLTAPAVVVALSGCPSSTPSTTAGTSTPTTTTASTSTSTAATSTGATPPATTTMTTTTASAPAGNGPQVVTRSDDKGSVTLATGAPLLVKLGLSSGTGFSWRLLQTDKTIVDQSDAMTTESADPGLPGGAQTQVFHLVGKGAGTTAVQFGLARGTSSPQNTFTINVTVR